MIKGMQGSEGSRSFQVRAHTHLQATANYPLLEDATQPCIIVHATVEKCSDVLTEKTFPLHFGICVSAPQSVSVELSLMKTVHLHQMLFRSFD